jgi:hypothetical protein
MFKALGETPVPSVHQSLAQLILFDKLLWLRRRLSYLVRTVLVHELEIEGTHISLPIRIVWGHYLRLYVFLVIALEVHTYLLIGNVENPIGRSWVLEIPQSTAPICFTGLLHRGIRCTGDVSVGRG